MKGRTRFIQFDSRRCEACWKCVEGCNKKVIGKIDFFFHKHAKLSSPEKCTGCLRCVRVCGCGAIRAM